MTEIAPMLEDVLPLEDALIFELPTHEDVEAFGERFRSRFDGWSDGDGEGWLFFVRLEADSDLAGLLREAEELVGELRLDAIRFCIDGRIYVLVATWEETVFPNAA